MTNEELKSELLDLLTKKLNVLVDMLVATTDVDMDVEETAAEEYVLMVEERDEHLKTIKTIDELLLEQPFADFMKTSEFKQFSEATLVLENITVTIERIIEADKKLSEKAPAVLNSLKENARKLAAGKKNIKSYNQSETFYDNYRGDFDTSN